MGKTIKQTVYLRADAGSSIGYGHFTRSLALANILKDHYTCKFVTVEPTQYQISEMDRVGSYIALQSKTHCQDFLSILEEQAIVVLDNYFFDTEYQKKIRDKKCLLVCIDDRKGIAYNCDAVINHVIGVNPTDIIALSPNTAFYLGSDYALLRPAFVEAMKKEWTLPNNNKILIAMGGTDYCNYTHMIAKLLIDNSNYNIEILTGDAYKYISDLSLLDQKRITIHKNLKEARIVELLKNIMLVVSPPSTFAYEVCSIGRPLIVGSFAPGHSDVAELLTEYGLAENCGYLKDLTLLKLMSFVSKSIDQSGDYIKNQKDKFNGSQKENLLNIFNRLNNDYNQ